MNQKMPKISHFTTLDAWKKNHELTIAVYKATARFPNSEAFARVFC